MYLRIDLTGAHFAGIPTLIQGDGDTDGDPNEANALSDALGSNVSSGGPGKNFAVLELTENDVLAANMIAVVIPQVAENSNDLQLTITTGSVSANIASYTNPDDALDQVNATSTFKGSGTILTLRSGLTVTIKAATNPVASVDHGFRWFVKANATPPLTGQVRLGWLGVAESTAATVGMRDSRDGSALAVNDVIPEGGMVQFDVMGNLDIGAFRTKVAAVDMGECVGVAKGAVDRGTLKDSADKLLIGEKGELPSGVTSATTGDLARGVNLLCLNVDVTGPETNMNAIPAGAYTATAYTKTSATDENRRMVGEGNLASIRRNGAMVEIPYLTTSEKHNQRLIIVNRGTRPAPITDITFTTEEGTEVELTSAVQAAKDAGLLVVPPRSSWVARMDETIVITGSSRRIAASLALAATAGNISVATTQVNVSDGSTDTVVYTVTGG